MCKDRHEVARLSAETLGSLEWLESTGWVGMRLERWMVETKPEPNKSIMMSRGFF